jgi:hypothetical protein
MMNRCHPLHRRRREGRAAGRGITQTGNYIAQSNVDDISDLAFDVASVSEAPSRVSGRRGRRGARDHRWSCCLLAPAFVSRGFPFVPARVRTMATKGTMSSTFRLWCVSARQEADSWEVLGVESSRTASADISGATLATFTMCPLCTCTSDCLGELGVDLRTKPQYTIKGEGIALMPGTVTQGRCSHQC